MTTDESSSDRSFGEVSEREEIDENVQDTGSQVSERTEGTTTEEKTSEETVPEEEKTKEPEPQLTEKGTKLDPNPQSAVHQQLANERRSRLQMERVLSDPKLIVEYMKRQFGDVQQEEPKQTIQPKVYKSEDFERIDDVAKVVNDLQTGFITQINELKAKNEKLSSTVQSLVDGGRQQQVSNVIEKDVVSLRGEKELNQEDPDFIPGLEEEIVDLYRKLDYDEVNESFRGNYSIADVGRTILAAARKARSVGSLRAQTIVKDKSAGRVKTSPSVDVEAESEDSAPATSIAKGISKLFR